MNKVKAFQPQVSIVKFIIVINTKNLHYNIKYVKIHARDIFIREAFNHTFPAFLYKQR